MKTRGGREYTDLKTKTIKLDVLGGDGKYCESCRIFYEGIHDLQLSMAFKNYNSYSSVNSVAKVVYCANIDKVLVLTTRGYIYRWENLKGTPPYSYSGLVDNLPATAVQCIYKGEHAAAVIAGSRITFVKKDGYENRVVEYGLIGGAFHRGRLFAADKTDRTILRWSSEDLTDWKESANGAGYVYLRPDKGNILALISYKEHLVVVRECGLDLIKALDPKYITIDGASDKFCTSAISGDTVAECGGKIYFCAADGFFCFDGNSIERLNIRPKAEVSNFCSASSCEGRYYFLKCFNLKENTKHLLMYDTVTKGYSIINTSAQFVWQYGSEYYALYEGIVYIKDTSVNSAIWNSVPINFGTAEAKTLKYVHIDITGELKVIIKSDGSERTFTESGTHYVGMTGKNFTFTVNGRGSCTRLEAEWEVRDCYSI